MKEDPILIKIISYLSCKFNLIDYLKSPYGLKLADIRYYKKIYNHKVI